MIRISAFSLAPGLLFLALLLPAGALHAGTGASTSAPVSHPAPGSPERKAILDALRADILRLHRLKVEFVVDEFRLTNGWAWVTARPRSPDGASDYEDVAALLANHAGTWTVADYLCSDKPEETECHWFESLARIRKRHPEAPAEVFPDFDWQTYRSPKAAVEFRYPPRWRILDAEEYSEPTQDGKVFARVDLARVGAGAEEESNDWIRLNPLHSLANFLADGYCECVNGNHFCTLSQQLEVVEALGVLAESFQDGSAKQLPCDQPK